MSSQAAGPPLHPSESWTPSQSVIDDPTLIFAGMQNPTDIAESLPRLKWLLRTQGKKSLLEVNLENLLNKYLIYLFELIFCISLFSPSLFLKNLFSPLFS